MAAKKRIGLLISNLQSGGAEKVMCNMSHILAQHYDVYFFVFDSENISYDYSGQLIDLKCKAKKSIVLKVLTRLLRIVKLSYYKRKVKPEAIISFLNPANMVNIWSIGKSKTIVSCRGYGDYKLHKQKYYKNFHKIETMIVQTQRMKNEFVKEFHVSDNKVRVLKNPFNIENIINMAKESISQEHVDFFMQHKIICTVGSYKRDKGFWHLIKAFHQVKETIPDAGLVIVGHGGPMEKEMKRMVSDSCYSKDILLLGYQKNPFMYIAESDVFVCSSIHEGFPNVMIEAMLCKTPIVSTDCMTGPKEILCDKTDTDIGASIYEAECGILVPPLSEIVDYDINNISEKEKLLAASIKELLVDKNKAKAMIDCAFEKAKRYDYDFFSQELFEIIKL